MPPVIISLLHATAQPENCENTAKLWLDRADNMFHVEHLMAWERSFFEKAPRSSFKEHSVFSVAGSPVIGWNACAALAHGRIFVMMADDVYPSQHWDSEIISAIPNDFAEAVLWVTTLDDNGVDLWPTIITHPVVTKAYVDRYGYLLHPAYFARFSDLEFSDKAKQDGVVIDYRNKIYWRHENHQVAGDWHASSEKINSLHAADEVTYHARSKAGFPKECEEFNKLQNSACITLPTGG